MPTTITATTTSRPSPPTPARLAAEQARWRETFEDTLRELHALRAEGESTWDRQWELVGEILDHDPPLWWGTYASESDLIRRELPGETLRSVRRNVIVARAFTAADVAARGMGVLEEIALYLMEREEAARPPRAIDLDRVRVMLPSGRRGEVARIPAREVELEQVRAARRALRKSRAAARRIGTEEHAIRTALARKRALDQVSVRVAGDAVSFGNVPLDSLADLAVALQAVRLPIS